MATIRKALWYHLTQDSAISALVSTRVYHQFAPSGTALPYVTYQRISHDHMRHLTAGSSHAVARYQVDGWAKDTQGADALAEAIREALDNYRGNMGESGDTVAAVSFLESDRDDMVGPSDDAQPKTFRVSLDFSIAHAETETG